MFDINVMSKHDQYCRFLVPVSMIICNDIMAYMFGFFFGRTPLIKLSPKKTWEGFIGGAFATVVFGLCVSIKRVIFDAYFCEVDNWKLKGTQKNLSKMTRIGNGKQDPT